MSRTKGSKNKRDRRLEILNRFAEAKGSDAAEQALGPRIRITLKLLGRIYEAEGNTVDEVLNNLKPGGWAKGAGVLIVERDGIIREKIIAGNHIRNLFGMTSGTRRAISLKWVRSLFE